MAAQRQPLYDKPYYADPLLWVGVVFVVLPLVFSADRIVAAYEASPVNAIGGSIVASVLNYIVFMHLPALFRRTRRENKRLEAEQ